MKKKDLQETTGISAGAIDKPGRNENIATAILPKICKALACNIGDIMDMVQDDK